MRPIPHPFQPRRIIQQNSFFPAGLGEQAGSDHGRAIMPTSGIRTASEEVGKKALRSAPILTQSSESVLHGLEEAQGPRPYPSNSCNRLARGVGCTTGAERLLDALGDLLGTLWGLWGANACRA